jgi:hypothetical protein
MNQPSEEQQIIINHVKKGLNVVVVAKYTPIAHTDTGIRYLLHQNLTPTTPIQPQDIIVLDETQDMTLLYFQLIIKYMRDMGTPFQLMVLGDYMQGLYEFKGADIRFLTPATTNFDPLEGIRRRILGVKIKNRKGHLKTFYILIRYYL